MYTVSIDDNEVYILTYSENYSKNLSSAESNIQPTLNYLSKNKQVDSSNWYSNLLSSLISYKTIFI